MAKNSMFWGQASGKLGEAVLYQANGQERSRAYVANPKNPKTRKQARQRLGFASLTQVYNLVSSFIKFGFPGKKANQSGYNAFIAANIPATAGLISQSASDARLCYPFNVVFTKGDLMDIQCGWNSVYHNVRDVVGDAQDCTVFNGLQFKLVKKEEVYGEQYEGTDPDKDWLPALGDIKKGKSLYNLLVSGGNLMELPERIKVSMARFTYDEEKQGWAVKLFSETISADSEADISKWQLCYLASSHDDKFNVTVDALGSKLENSMTEGICVFIISYTDPATNKTRVSKSRVSVEDSEVIKAHVMGGSVYKVMIDQYVIDSNDTLATGLES